MLRSTKIVATLGPASNDPATLERLLNAGVNMVRLNFSHGTADDHIGRAAVVREIAKKLGRPVAVLVDLQGPKIRVGKFEKNKITLTKGDKFILELNAKWVIRIALALTTKNCQTMFLLATSCC